MNTLQGFLRGSHLRITDQTDRKDRLTDKKEWFGTEAGVMEVVGMLEETVTATVTMEGEKNIKAPRNGGWRKSQNGCGKAVDVDKATLILYNTIQMRYSS